MSHGFNKSKWNFDSPQHISRRPGVQSCRRLLSLRWHKHVGIHPPTVCRQAQDQAAESMTPVCFPAFVSARSPARK